MTRIGYAATDRLHRHDAGDTTGAVRAIAPRSTTGANSAAAPCSFAQEQFWYVDQLSPGTVAYNFSWPVRLRGRLNVSALEQALTESVRRHEALRTRFVAEEGRPLQVVDDPRQVRLAVTVVEDDEALQRLIAEEGRRPFDLSAAAPFRVRLLRLGEEDHVLQI